MPMTGDCDGAARRNQGRRAGRDRAGADVRDAARRSGRRRCCASTARSRADSASTGRARFDLLLRGRRAIAVDLKTGRARRWHCGLIDGADALIEGFRPGVTERLGLGPEPSASRATRALSMAGSPAGARRGRWRRPPGTTSITSRLPARLQAIGRHGAADPALEPARRFRRRRAVSRLRHRLPAIIEARQSGQGPGRRCGDGRRRRLADDRVSRHARRRAR